MSDTLSAFIDRCRLANPMAREAGFPPFAASLGCETPLNSAPYLLTISEFADIFATTTTRRTILDEMLEAVEDLTRTGTRIRWCLVGGSFLRIQRTPKDVDVLAFYEVAEGSGPSLRRSDRPSVDIHLCPLDTHPLVLIKRLVYFNNLFGYDRETGRIDRGAVLIDLSHGSRALT